MQTSVLVAALFTLCLSVCECFWKDTICVDLFTHIYTVYSEKLVWVLVPKWEQRLKLAELGLSFFFSFLKRFYDFLMF